MESGRVILIKIQVGGGGISREVERVLLLKIQVGMGEIRGEVEMIGISSNIK